MELLNLSTLAEGAVQEQFEIALKKIIDNITDLNTDEKKARKIKMEIVFNPKKGRRTIDLLVKTRTELVADYPIETSIAISGKGECEEFRQTSVFDAQIDKDTGEIIRPDNVRPIKEGAGK